MAINKKLIHFKTWDKFIADGVQGNYSEPSEIKPDGTAVYGQLLGTSIVFIKDVQKIWTHGKLYNCKDPDQILSESSENTVQNKIVASEFKRVWESIEEESKRKEVIIIDISNEWADGEVHDTGLSFEQYVNSKVIFRIPAGPNGESVTCEKVSLFANGTSSNDTFYEVYIGRTNLVDIPFVFTVSPIYSNDNVNVGIQYDVDNNFGPILPYVGNGNSAQFLAGDGTWKTVETESEIYNFSFNNWNGKTSYDELNSAYKSGKMIYAEGMPALVISSGNDVDQVLVSLHAPDNNGLVAGLVYLTFTDDWQIQSEVQQVLLENKGSGNLFLSDDGTYKFVETNPFEIPANGVLPETGKAGKIYIIPSSVTGEDNIMQEYIWVDNKWEKLGEFKANVDLSGYYTKTETNTLVNTTRSNLNKSIEDLNVDVTAKLDTKLDISVANETLATKDEVNRKQNILVSGTNIKTINGESVLGLGDLVIDTSVLNTVGTHTGKAMSQKATTDAIQSETERATGVENNLQTQITQHESITQNALDTASYAEALAVDANTRSQNAETVANSAIAAVRALEGLGSTDEAQTTLAERVAQITVNSDAITVLQEKHVLISEDDYEALEFKDPTKIYLIYEE